MHNRLCLTALLLLMLPLAACADGFAYGKGFSQQLRETDQLAVIHLTESTADVSMYIAIDGIPAGKTLTYILPFWHRPDGFSMREEDAETFRDISVAPAHQRVMRMQRIVSHSGSESFRRQAIAIGSGVIGLLIFSPRMMSSSAKGHAGILQPYATHSTPHASAELFHIGGNDLQQLVKQAGLPEGYVKPLRKYDTPYFAVMRLTGLPRVGEGFPTRGVHYHFRHRLRNGEYTYPLGTGAAWPQPIPLTEVYITCPDSLALEVEAPREGKWTDLYKFQNYLRIVTAPLDEQKKYIGLLLRDDADYQAARTSSLLDLSDERPSAWHRAYLQSNPDEDIHVRVSRRAHAWRLAVVDFLSKQERPFVVSIVLYALAWLITSVVVIHPRWKLSDAPDSFGQECVMTFIHVQGLLITVTICAMGLLYAWWAFKEGFAPVAIFAAVITVIVAAVLVGYFRDTTDRRSWLALRCLLVSSLIYGLSALALYWFMHWCETI